MKSLFEYVNYREYLRDYYAEKKASEGFTYRKFAEMAGVNSSSWLLLVIQGRKRLSADYTVRVSKLLGHSAEETEYFENLVNFNQARNTEIKDHYFRKIADIRKRLVKNKKLNVALITDDQYEYYHTWYNPVVRSLVSKVDFGEDYAKLGRQLIPHISAAQARRSIALLKRLRLIERTGDGRWRQCNSVISTGEDVDSLNVINYHKQTTKIAGRMFDNCVRDQRDVSSLTMGITEKQFRQIKRSIHAFRKDVIRIAEQADDDETDRVYQLNLQLFPMAIVAGGKKRG